MGRDPVVLLEGTCGGLEFRRFLIQRGHRMPLSKFGNKKPHLPHVAPGIIQLPRALCNLGFSVPNGSFESKFAQNKEACHIR